MKIDWLKPLVGRPGPFATVYVDATPDPNAGEQDVTGRWRSVRRALTDQGAPADLLERLEELVLRPTRTAGPHGRIVIADTDEILVDRVVGDPPARPVGVWGDVPALSPAVRAAEEAVRLLVAVVDRFGGDLTFIDGDLGDPRTWSVDGGHDAVSKVRVGGTAQKRAESRAEDSWVRNAQVVAAVVEKAAAKLSPELIVLSGDVRAVALVRENLTRPVEKSVVEVPGATRAAGLSAGSFMGKLYEELALFRGRRRGAIVDKFRMELGRGDGAVTSLEDVVTVLSRGQVAELILDDSTVRELSGPDVTRRLWIGSEPLQIAELRSTIEQQGTQRVEELPATVALVRAALGQDAGVTVVPSGSVDLIDGVGASLRWSDGSTPHETAATMSRG